MLHIVGCRIVRMEGGGVVDSVGANVRRFRLAAGMSQVQVAERAGLSRRTLVNLEAGEANIGLSALDRLAAAVGVTFIDLVRPPAAPDEAIEALAWRGQDSRSQATLLGAVPASREAQLWVWSLAPDERYEASPDPAGWHEMLVVTSGQLRLEREQGTTNLAAGEYAIYSSAQYYAYLNPSRDLTSFVRNVVH